MNKQQAFDTVVGEFRSDMSISAAKAPTRFAATAPNGARYSVSVSWGQRYVRTGEPSKLRIYVEQGPHTIHSGEWRSIDQAQLAAQIAISTIRNTNYMQQGTLL